MKEYFLAINPIDYSRELNRNREDYNRASKQKDDAHNKQIEALENTHKKQLENQESSYNKDRNKIEDSFQRSLKHINESQRESLDTKSKAFKETIEGEKQRASDERRAYNKEFKNRLDSLTDSYSQKLSDSESSNKKRQESLKEGYNERLDHLKTSTQKELSDFKNNAIQKNNELKNNFNEKKQNLINSHQDEVIGLQKSELEKRNLMKEQIVKSLDKTKANQESERLLQRDLSKARFDKVQLEANEKVKSTKEISAKEVERLLESQKKDNQARNKEFAEILENKEKDFSKTLRARDNKEKGSHNEGGGLRAKMEAETIKQKDLYMKDRINSARTEQKDQRIHYEKKILEERNKFQNEFKNQAVNNSIANDIMKKDIVDQSFKNISKERIIKDNLINSYELKQKIDKANADEVIISERELNKQKYNTLKSTFKKSLNDAERKSRENFDIMRAESINEKRELLTEIAKKNTADKSEIKEKLNRKINLVTDAYENKIKSLESANRELRLNMENNINDLNFKSKFEVERQKKINDEQRSKTLGDFRKILNENEERYKNSLTNLQKTYEAKILTDKKAQHKTIQDLKNKNKLEISQIKETNRLEKETISKENERTITKLKNESDFEKQTLVTKYEDKINQMQDRQRELIEQIKEFKKVDQA